MHFSQQPERLHWLSFYSYAFIISTYKINRLIAFPKMLCP